MSIESHFDGNYGLNGDGSVNCNSLILFQLWIYFALPKDLHLNSCINFTNVNRESELFYALSQVNTLWVQIFFN